MSNYLEYIPKDLARELRGFGMPLELCDFLSVLLITTLRMYQL